MCQYINLKTDDEVKVVTIERNGSEIKTTFSKVAILNYAPTTEKNCAVVITPTSLKPNKKADSMGSVYYLTAKTVLIIEGPLLPITL